MSKLFSTILPCILVLLAISCQPKSKQQQFIEFVQNPDNGITQSIRVGEVDVIARYLPHYNQVTNSVKSIDEYYYFDVSFLKQTGDKPAKEKILYLAFDMQNDFTFFTGVDSASPRICQKIENGMAGNYKYILAFERAKYNNHNQDLTLFYRDKIFGLGVIAFVFKQKDIKRIPVL